MLSNPGLTRAPFFLKGFGNLKPRNVVRDLLAYHIPTFYMPTVFLHSYSIPTLFLECTSWVPTGFPLCRQRASQCVNYGTPAKLGVEGSQGIRWYVCRKKVHMMMRAHIL